MLKTKLVFALSALLLTTTACRSTNVMVVEPQVESPEVGGRHGEYGARAQVIPTRSFRVARSPDVRPPNLALRSEETEASVATLGLDAGLSSNFEVGAYAGPGIMDSACAGVVGKSQLYGPSRATARAGDLTIGVASHFSACEASNDGDGVLPASTNFAWKTKSYSQTLDLGASIGYHLRDTLMVYGGLALGATRAEDKVTQRDAIDGSTKGGQYKAHANGEAQSVALGLNYGGPRTWVSLRAVFARNNSDYINPDHVSAALGAGYQF